MSALDAERINCANANAPMLLHCQIALSDALHKDELCAAHVLANLAAV